MGHCGTEDRLYRPRRPVRSQVVRRYRQDRGREPLADRLPRRVQAHRPEPHLAQPDHARGHPGQRIQQVEHQGNARTQGHPPLHARTGRRGRLHAGRVRQPAAIAVPHRCEAHRRCKPRAPASWRCSSSSRARSSRLRFARRLQRQGWQVSARHGFPQGPADRLGRDPRPGRRGGEIRGRGAAQREELVSGRDHRPQWPANCRCR